MVKVKKVKSVNKEPSTKSVGTQTMSARKQTTNEEKRIKLLKAFIYFNSTNKGDQLLAVKEDKAGNYLTTSTKTLIRQQLKEVADDPNLKVGGTFAFKASNFLDVKNSAYKKAAGDAAEREIVFKVIVSKDKQDPTGERIAKYKRDADVVLDELSDLEEEDPEQREVYNLEEEEDETELARRAMAKLEDSEEGEEVKGKHYPKTAYKQSNIGDIMEDSEAMQKYAAEHPGNEYLKAFAELVAAEANAAIDEGVEDPTVEYVTDFGTYDEPGADRIADMANQQLAKLKSDIIRDKLVKYIGGDFSKLQAFALGNPYPSGPITEESGNPPITTGSKIIGDINAGLIPGGNPEDENPDALYNYDGALGRFYNISELELDIIKEAEKKLENLPKKIRQKYIILLHGDTSKIAEFAGDMFIMSEEDRQTLEKLEKTKFSMEKTKFSMEKAQADDGENEVLDGEDSDFGLDKLFEEVPLDMQREILGVFGRNTRAIHDFLLEFRNTSENLLKFLTDYKAAHPEIDKKPISNLSEALAKSAKKDLVGGIPILKNAQPRYHPIPLALYFGDAGLPPWESELEATIQRLDIPKEDIIRWGDDIIEKYGKRIFIDKRKSDTKIEFNELLQLQFCVMRNLNRGSRGKTATVNLSDLIGDNSPVADVPDAPPANSSAPVVLPIEEAQANFQDAYNNRTIDINGRSIEGVSGLNTTKTVIVGPLSKRQDLVPNDLKIIGAINKKSKKY